MKGHGSHAVVPGLVYGHAHGLFGLHEAEAPIAIDDSRVRRFPLHFKGRTLDNMAPVDAAAILQQLDYAVGVATHQVGLHLVGGDDFRLLFRRPLGDLALIGDLVQVIVLKDGHGKTLRGVLMMLEVVH